MPPQGHSNQPASPNSPQQETGQYPQPSSTVLPRQQQHNAQGIPPQQAGQTGNQQSAQQTPTQSNPQTLAAANKRNTPQQKQEKGRKTGKKDKANTTQKSLLISEIRDGIVIMKDGSLRSVVMCQSINFDLMSPQEREGVEKAYQQFLNSLEFSIQIYIRSQRINLDDYLDRLEQTRQNQDNILLSLLMEDYIEYIKYLIEAANIMDKQFYVVVPYYPTGLSEGVASGIQKFAELLKSKRKDVVTLDEANFKKYKQELTRQVRTVVNGLNQMGTQAIPLNTQELIELYYNVYNPVTSKQEKLTDVNQLESPLVEKGEGEASQVLPGERT